MADIFLSYKREDKQVAERLSIALEQLGFDVWWDLNLISGQPFRAAIRAVIDQCKAAIVLWSEKSVQSEFVMDEASYAHRLGKLCPARIDGVDLPMGFGQTHTADLVGWEGEATHQGFQNVVSAVESRVGRKGKFGAGARSAEAEAGAAELEAFKAAQYANSAQALRAFLQHFPHGMFAAFVRGQLESMAVEARQSMTAASDTTLPALPESPRFAPSHEPPHAPAFQPVDERQRSWPWPVIAGAALAVAVVACFAALRPWGSQDVDTPERSVPVQIENSSYSLNALHPDVRIAVERARDYAQRAESRAARAREAATRAHQADARARAGEPGTFSYTYSDGGTISGDFSGGDWNGYAVVRTPQGVYAGQVTGGSREGLGTFTYNEDQRTLVSYEGEWTAGRQHGVGVTTLDDGRMAGARRNGHMTGPNVYTCPRRCRQEGDWTNADPDGLLVTWDHDGHIQEAGIYTSGQLTQSLEP